MENSIHELIDALHPSAHGHMLADGQKSSAFPGSSPTPRGVPPPTVNDDQETDEDENATRPTGGGSDESSERINTFS
jgi:hypothetical protein